MWKVGLLLAILFIVSGICLRLFPMLFVTKIMSPSANHSSSATFLTVSNDTHHNKADEEEEADERRKSLPNSTLSSIPLKSAGINPNSNNDTDVQQEDIHNAELNRINVLRGKGNYTPWYSCPPTARINHKTADGKKMASAISKYTRYVASYCQSTGMLQMHVSSILYVKILRKIIQLAEIKQNDRIFDFGSGCGTMLNYFYLQRNVTGIGVDITPSAVDFAMQHAQPQQTFCLGDIGTVLPRMKSNSFDAVVSWSVLHHIRRKLSQCEVVQQLLRIVKPGGIVFVGHLRGEHTQGYWIKNRRCQPPNATMNILTDHRVFHIEAFKRNKYPSLLFRKLM